MASRPLYRKSKQLSLRSINKAVRDRLNLTGIRLHPKVIEVIVRFTVDALNERPKTQRQRFVNGLIVSYEVEEETLELLRWMYPMGKYLSALRIGKLRVRYLSGEEELRDQDRAALLQARIEAGKRQNYALMQAIDRVLRD